MVCRSTKGFTAVKTVASFQQIFFYNGKVDFRRSIDGLATIAIEELKVNPYQNTLFLFFSKRRDKVKCLYWDKSGFALWYKRLEKERFKIPKNFNDLRVELSTRELEWLLDGYDISKLRPHEELHFEVA